MAIQILQDVAIHGGIQFLDAKENFPENPSIGTMVLKGTAIYAYIAIGGMETWYPFANRTNSYVHVQGLPNTTWTINHQLHTTDVWVQVKDSNGRIVNATVTATNEDTVTINFTTAITGTAVIVAPDSINVPEVKTSLISVGPNVTINTNGVLINGSYALTAANIDQQIADAVSVETTARQSADVTLTNNLAAEVTARIAADSALQTAINNEISTRSYDYTTIRSIADSAYNAAMQSVRRVDVGVPLGIVPLNKYLQIDPIYLPSYVDDVIEFFSINVFPPEGEFGKIYVDTSTNKTYRWSGSTYIEISSGAVDSVNGKTGVVTLTKYDVGLGNVENTLDADKMCFSATRLTTSRNISISGDANWSVDFDGSYNVTSALTLGNSGVTAGTYNNSATSVTPFTVDSKGRVTGVGSSVNITPSFSSITDKPTTVAGYGITDALSASANNIPVAHGSISSAIITTSSTTANQVVDSNAISNVRTVKYLVQVTSGSSYQTSEILVIHDGASAYLSEFGTVTTSAILASFDADISSNQLRLLVTPVNAVSTIKVIKTIVAA